MSDETVRVPAADILALADEMETATEYGTMPGVRMRVRREWAARLRSLATSPADPYAEIREDMREDERKRFVERPTAGEGEGQHPKFEAFKAERLQNPEIKAAYDEARERNAPVGEPLCKCGHHVGNHDTKGCHWKYMTEGTVLISICKCVQYTPAPLSSPRRTRDEGSEDAAKAFKRGWIDSAVHHATCNGCGTGPLRHDIPDYRPRAARLAGEDDRHG